MRPISVILIVTIFTNYLSIQSFAQDNLPPQTSSSYQYVDSGAQVTGNMITINHLLEQSKFTARQGHAFAAERGNNLIDVLHGKNAAVIGDDNVKNGPDRRILSRDGSTILIQDKYYADAKKSVDACFEKNTFRYVDGNGNPMQIEVPSDQYEEAVQHMKDRITKGEIPGISDPAEAETIVRKGSLTYQQAVNLAKAGTIESLTYDAINGTVSAACGFGISTLLNYAVARRNGSDRKEAIKAASIAGLKAGGVVFATSVISSQLARTEAVAIFAPSAEALTNALGEEFAKALLASVGKETAGMTTETIMAKAAKVLRNQGLTASITIIVLTTGDVVDLFRGRISSEQFIKNLTTTSAAVIGGYVGSALGGAVGSAVAPGVGTQIGSVAGAVVVGGATGAITNTVVGIFIKDDSEKMVAILETEFQKLAEDYILNENEADAVVEVLKDKLDSKTLKDMYSSNNQEEFADNLIEPLMLSQVKKRPVMEEPSEEELRNELKMTLADVVFIH